MIDKNIFFNSLKKSKAVIDDMIENQDVRDSIYSAIRLVFNCLQGNRKLLFAGNGGSAADAQHMSAEYVSRFMFDRPGLPSIALTTDTSALTAIGNDYGFEKVFSRQIQALGNEDDVLFAYSTSGTSPNIIHGLEEAKNSGVKCIGMTGSKPQSQIMADLCDVTIRVPSSETPYIQEGHLIIGHLICLHVEELIFKK
ncbi:D-sedoheptulose-7-phosphate isomerase [Yersinia alsatica]|nr:D-sedoheptulose 7-phosphate isomerase [Yersinia alsatica]CNK84161.1 phosphoheptose isomerase [Yersinia frederiksenii]CNK92160.1 phosphoheptose isomerase [Yersinia frederiksenii]